MEVNLKIGKIHWYLDLFLGVQFLLWVRSLPYTRKLSKGKK
jgi:hypothetical protein